MNQIFASYVELDLMYSRVRDSHSRNKGYAPIKSKNKFGAWAWRCSIKEKNTGPLLGKRIAVKDNVNVAGVPLRDGSSILDGYFPEEDAIIVKRILSAGGEITGKAQCENLCVSGGSHTSYPIPVRNPRNPEFMAGGSSSGSAALLAAGEVDMAIGADQAGSIRIPASWCGVYGLKPTWGLVPYTGVVPMEYTLDHVGPMANNVEDLALLLEVIAGRDDFDQRQRDTPVELPRYARELKKGVGGMKIGVVKEGFGLESLSEPDVDEIVRRESLTFERLGATVKEISIPEHLKGFHIWTGLIMEGTWNTAIRKNGLEHTSSDLHLIESWAKRRRKDFNNLVPNMKLIALTGSYFAERYNGRFFTIAQLLRRKLVQTYNAALHGYDLLLMPTTPQKAQKLKKMNLQEYLDATMCNLYNTCPFDVTGHPALSMPCGTSMDLPVGMMVIGRHFEETRILRAAYSYEKFKRE